jgi:hypothetical protein
VAAADGEIGFKKPSGPNELDPMASRAPEVAFSVIRTLGGRKAGMFGEA